MAIEGFPRLNMDCVINISCTVTEEACVQGLPLWEIQDDYLKSDLARAYISRRCWHIITADRSTGCDFDP